MEREPLIISPSEDGERERYSPESAVYRYPPHVPLIQMFHAGICLDAVQIKGNDSVTLAVSGTRKKTPSFLFLNVPRHTQ